MTSLAFRTRQERQEEQEFLDIVYAWPAEKVLPSRPACRLHFPTCLFGRPGAAFGRLTLEREIRGSRNVDGKVEILCRYGRAEKWYPVRRHV